MATTLLEGAESAPDVSEHPGHDEEEEEEFLHPWAREMYRRGFSFNGDERTKLFLGSGDELVDVSDVSHADSPLDGRALVAADFDDDGDVDLFVHNIQRERHHLFRNDVDPANGEFISIQLESKSREPIGATIRVTPQSDEQNGEIHRGRTVAQVLSRGAGFASSQPNRLVFGLGDMPAARIEVRWPYGDVEDFGVVLGESRVVLEQGSGKARDRERVGRFRLADPLPPGLKTGLGERLPVLTFEDANGRRVIFDPAKRAGEGTVDLEIWASYCRPCVEKLPGLVKRVAAGTNVVALSVDVPADRQRAVGILEAHEVDFDSYYLTLDDDANAEGFDRVVDLMRLPIPTTLVIGPGGVLQEVRTGSKKPDPEQETGSEAGPGKTGSTASEGE